MPTLHNEFLPRRYLFHRLNFLEGLLGFGLGIFCAFAGLCKLGLLRLRVKLQCLMLLDEDLELLLHLATRASCFSRSVRSQATLFSASNNAFCRVATLVVAP